LPQVASCKLQQISAEEKLHKVNDATDGQVQILKDRIQQRRKKGKRAQRLAQKQGRLGQFFTPKGK